MTCPQCAATAIRLRELEHLLEVAAAQLAEADAEAIRRTRAFDHLSAQVYDLETRVISLLADLQTDL